MDNFNQVLVTSLKDMGFPDAKIEESGKKKTIFFVKKRHVEKLSFTF